ncbi:hypothetical protein MVEN_00937700 [Mycena venus]|uniref:F-box domain-containing protein n=1 Tax=Mycena venus TaxID=2733690 RepID=A0A8H6YAA7_9AGAR|nr:hypothetical protein MVEN_00937700 [Mycena venus]
MTGDASSPPPSSIPQIDEAGPRLPAELFLLILEHLSQADIETLRQTCLVSKQWLSISQSRLFEHICLGAPTATSYPRTPCSSLYEVLCGSPYIARYIRHVTILSGPSWTTPAPVARRWISSDETLPTLLDLLLKSSVQSFRMRLSESWLELPVDLQSSIQLLINSPSMRDVDFTGFNVVDPAIFKNSRSLQRLKFSEIGEFRTEKKSDKNDAWLATFTSLTILDTVGIGAIISWAIATPSFNALRDLRLGFHPLHDVPCVEDLLRHISGTLECLHLQPVYTRWPDPPNFLPIDGLSALTSLRLSLGISEHSNPVPWVIFLLGRLGHNRLEHLTIDLRIDDDRTAVDAIPWAALDSALNEPPLADLHALVLTVFPYTPIYIAGSSQGVASRELVRWLVDEMPHLLPRTAARDVFEGHELNFPPSRFFYWPGPLLWQNSER